MMWPSPVAEARSSECSATPCPRSSPRSWRGRSAPSSSTARRTVPCGSCRPGASPRLPPEPLAPVPEQYLALVGEHDAHPGTGKGRAARAREEAELPLTTAARSA